MSLRMQLTIGTFLLLTGLALAAYTVYSLSSTPYVCAMALLWLGFVEYAVARSWWVDVCEVQHSRRGRT